MVSASGVVQPSLFKTTGRTNSRHHDTLWAEAGGGGLGGRGGGVGPAPEQVMKRSPGQRPPRPKEPRIEEHGSPWFEIWAVMLWPLPVLFGLGLGLYDLLRWLFSKLRRWLGR